MNPRDLAKANEDVRDNGDDECGSHGQHFNTDERTNSSIISTMQGGIYD